MAFGDVQLIPGINTQKRATLNQAGYSESSLIRWKDGLAQKVGGWTQYYAFAVGGIPRALHAWQDLNETSRLAIGTTTEFDVLTSGSLAQITPQQDETDGAGFETVNRRCNGYGSPTHPCLGLLRWTGRFSTRRFRLAALILVRRVEKHRGFGRVCLIR